MIFIIIIAARRFERSELAPEDVIYLVLLLLYFFYFFISPIVFAARISSRCAGKKQLLWNISMCNQMVTSEIRE